MATRSVELLSEDRRIRKVSPNEQCLPACLRPAELKPPFRRGWIQCAPFYKYPPLATIIRSVLKKIVYPRHLWRVIQLERGKKHRARTYDDPQLKLYAKILPGDFLHYGYFDDAKIQPQDLSFNAIYRAQLRYAELILDKIEDRDSPILDVGCGMGGLIKLMLDKGLSPVALSPDRTQTNHIKTKYPQVSVIESRFEDISPADNSYGTIITSESLQYLNLDASLPLLEKLLRPGGRWLVCDYFRIGPAKERSGHQWNDFEQRILGAGWKFIHQQNITANVLPTISYAHMWGEKIVRPLLDFALEKFQTKHPAAHYVLEETIEGLDEKLDRNLEVVNPEIFAANKKYMLLVMARPEPPMAAPRVHSMTDNQGPARAGLRYR